MSIKLPILISTAVILSFSACEKLSWEDDATNTSAESSTAENHNITLRISSLEQHSFPYIESTRSTPLISDLCKRITFAVYNTEDGTKEKVIHQTSDDADFGHAGFDLPAGTHKVLAMAHSSEKPASVNSASKITFDANKVTDTFYEYATITVDDQPQEINMTLKRAVAMFRLIIKDEIPEDVEKLKFYYTGGSSTFSAIDRCGIVKSRQTVILNAATGNDTYEVFTFPRSDSHKLNMTITALDASDNVIAQKEFSNVPICVNKITEYTGNLFDDKNQTESGNIHISIDSKWGETIKQMF